MSSGSSSLQANFIVYGQQNSCFDGFYGVWTIKITIHPRFIHQGKVSCKQEAEWYPYPFSNP